MVREMLLGSADEVARNRGALENKLRPEVFLSAPFALSKIWTEYFGHTLARRKSSQN
jgi:hypothetical protein